jgi:hypothetical protein
VAVVERTGSEGKESDQGGARAAEPSAQSPREEEAAKSDRGADEPSRLEDAERKDFCCTRGQQIKPAVIHVKIGKRQRASWRALNSAW